MTLRAKMPNLICCTMPNCNYVGS